MFSVVPDTAQQAAAHWYARRARELSTAEQAEFSAWLASDPANRRAYDEVEAMLSRLSRLESHPEMAALRADAARLAQRQGQGQGQGRRRAAQMALGIAGLAVAACFAASIGLWNLSAERSTLQAGPGELKQATLSDGTRAWLGSDTRLEVAYTRGQRSVAVTRGEAFFDVAKNKHRPFVVTARDRTVTALGTAFDVRVYDPDITVTLVRGAVGVHRAPGEGGGETRLHPGQQYLLKDGVAIVRDVDAEAQVAWRQGVIELDDTSLSEAVATFNHNSRVKLLIGDDRLASLRVSGTFHTTRANDFARALQVELPIDAVPQSSGDILLKQR